MTTSELILGSTLARQHLVDCLELFRELEDPWGQSLALLSLGNLEYLEGRYEQVRPTLEESLGIAMEKGDTWAVGAALNSLGSVAKATGDH